MVMLKKKRAPGAAMPRRPQLAAQRLSEKRPAQMTRPQCWLKKKTVEQTRVAVRAVVTELVVHAEVTAQFVHAG